MNGRTITINGKQCIAFDKDTLPYRSGVYAVSTYPDKDPNEYCCFAYFSKRLSRWKQLTSSATSAKQVRRTCARTFYWYGFAEKQEA